MKATKRKQLAIVALGRLKASSNDEEHWSFVFRTPGAIGLTYCPWTTTEDWEFDGELEGLQLPWEAKRRREVEAGADLSPEELAQWRQAKCVEFAGGTERAHAVWIVPIRIDRRIQGYALFDGGGSSTPADDSPTLLGVYDTASEAMNELMLEGAVSMGGDISVKSFAGVDFSELCRDGNKPSRTAKLVAYVDLGSGPGGGDYRTMLIDRGRTSWRLWLALSDYDDGKVRRGVIAYADPKKAFDEVTAARIMLMRAWLDEAAISVDPPWCIVMQDGVLSSAEIQRIFNEAFAP